MATLLNTTTTLLPLSIRRAIVKALREEVAAAGYTFPRLNTKTHLGLFNSSSSRFANPEAAEELMVELQPAALREIISMSQKVGGRRTEAWKTVFNWVLEQDGEERYGKYVEQGGAITAEEGIGALINALEDAGYLGL